MQHTALRRSKMNADSSKIAVSHYHAIANFDFVLTLTVRQAVLAFVKGDVVEVLSSVRQKVEENLAKWFQEAFQIAERLGITMQKQRSFC